MKLGTLGRKRHVRRMSWTGKKNSKAILHKRSGFCCICSCQYHQFENKYCLSLGKTFTLSIELSWLSGQLSKRPHYEGVKKELERILTIFALFVWNSFNSHQRRVERIVGIFFVVAVSYSKSEYNNNIKLMLHNVTKRLLAWRFHTSLFRAYKSEELLEDIAVDGVGDKQCSCQWD